MHEAALTNFELAEKVCKITTLRPEKIRTSLRTVETLIYEICGFNKDEATTETQKQICTWSTQYCRKLSAVIKNCGKRLAVDYTRLLDNDRTWYNTTCEIFTCDLFVTEPEYPPSVRTPQTNSPTIAVATAETGDNIIGMGSVTEKLPSTTSDCKEMSERTRQRSSAVIGKGN